MHTIPRIDYKKIIHAISYYTSYEYTEKQVPWIIGYDAYKATKPPYARDFYTIDGYINASGEQSYLQQMLEGEKLTKHFCITPCFREEEVLDEIHYRYFLKVELINTDVSHKNLQTMVDTARAFFNTYTPVEVVQTDKRGEAFDIIDKKYGIELGSYGIRRHKNFSWIYGTGVALPRLDVVINKQ